MHTIVPALALCVVSAASVHLLSCGRLKGSGIWIVEATPRDSAAVYLTDTITVTIDYEYGDEYELGGVVLAMEFLCDEEVVHEAYPLDTLEHRAAIEDFKFTLAQYPGICDYANMTGLRVIRFKLILEDDGEYARVVKTFPLHYFLR